MDEQDLGLAEAEVVVPQDELSLQVQHRFQEFLESFSLADLLDSQSNNDDDDDDLGEDSSTLLYEQQALCMIGNENSTLYVDLSHVLRKDNVLAEAILGDYYRHSSYLNKAVQAFVQKVSPDSDATATGGLPSTSDSTKKEYFVSFYGVPTIDRIRQLKTDKIGKLTAICGTVTRTSEVRPELLFGKFECLKCGRIIEDVEQQFKFTEPMICPTEGCKNQSRFLHLHQEGKFVDWQKLRVQENANEVPAGSMPRTLEVIVRHEAVERAKPGDKCIFTGMLIAIPDVAKLKTPSDGPGLLRAPRGRRTKEENGQGVTGIKALGVREMSYKLAFLACGIQSINARFANVHVAGGQNLSRRQLLVRMLQMQHKSNAGESVEEESAESIREQYTAEDLAELSLMARQPNLLAKMRRSIAPSVHGHDDIKLGVLLMLFGGVHKRTSDGIKLRGDINVCIVGDPSTAKSQFLKYVCSFLPRAIYTSGKASSAAGLTASVIKDAETGEYTIEAGALMLADNGICCIDEFDKMDDVDQVAIHEAMEQQTISITKAGIQATLNARTSILAAANPINGRYDRSKTLRANVNLSAPIMSRFDLFFVVVDECEESQDRIIAEHIIRVHRRRIQLLVQNRNPEEIDDFDAFPTEEDPADENNNSNNPLTSTLTGQSQAEQRHQHIFTTSQLQSYIKYARTIDPIIPPEVQPMLVECYRKLRQGDAVGGNRTAYRITVRQLEALIRLAEALARLHLDDHIRPRYVEWAYKLLKTSIVQVESGNIRFEDPGEDARPGSALIRTMEVDDIDEDAGDSDAEADNMGNNNGINNDDRRRGPRVEWDGPPVGEEDMDESDSSMSGVDAESTSEEVADSARPVKSKKGQQRQQKRGADTLQISYDEYMRVGNLLASFLRRKEEEAGSGRAIPVAQRELVLFYLNQREDISSEEELVIARRLINQIIDRLISKDSILMQVSKPEEPQEADIESDEGDDDDDMFPDEKRYLIVHPNYDPTFH